MNTGTTATPDLIAIDNALHRNGVLTEKARREGRSLSYEERNTIYAARRAAALAGLNVQIINAIEMEGQMNKDLVLAPVKVKAKFAYYYETGDASYHILESNHPSLPKGGNVGADQLLEARVGIPLTPTYETWVKQGKPCFHGGK